MEGFDEFGRAIDSFVNNSSTTRVLGTYRGNPAILNYNSTTAQVVVQEPGGAFVSGQRMSPARLHRVIEGGVSVVAEFSWSSWVGPVAPYAVLLRLFVERRVTADEFELVFLRLYKLDPTAWPPEFFDVLDTLFGDVDAYGADDEVRREVGGLDADELQHRAASALSRLEELAG